MKILATAALIFTLNSVFAQETASLKIGAGELSEYFEATADSTGARIIRDVLTGKIKAYKDSACTVPFFVKQIQKMSFASRSETIQIPDDRDPNNTKDTLIEEELPTPQFRFLIMRSDFVHYYLDEERNFFLKRNEVDPMIGTPYINAHIKICGDSLRKFYDDENSMMLVGRFADTLHQLVKNGKIKAYKDVSLRTPYPAAEIAQISESLFKADSTGWFQASFKEQNMGMTTVFRCSSIAQCSAGPKSQARPLYYISRDDFESGVPREYSLILLSAIDFTAKHVGKK